MTTLTTHPDVNADLIPFPGARQPIAIRPAVLDDQPFIDGLQKLHSKMVGFMPRRQLETYIQRGQVLIAESSPLPPGEGLGVRGAAHCVESPVHPHPSPLPEGEGANPLGYIIARDQYFKRDDVGIIYQLNVVPGQQRGLIGASLLKAQFKRSAWGCRLYCCWCAQDLEANHFWEAMGFVPLAFRAGSEKKRRVHIFWQKRIRAEENQRNTGGTPVPLTPWWFPSKTNNGAIREDRIVLPIPPGTHWSDAKPMMLPGVPVLPGAGSEVDGGRSEESKPTTRRGLPSTRSSARGAPHAAKPSAIRRNGLRFEIPVQGEKLPETKPAKAARVKRACDPRHVAAARELRDRYLEQVNAGDERMLPAAHGKYDVSRQLAPAPGTGTSPNPGAELKQRPPRNLLNAA